jgi:hypothetical protein
MSLSQVLRGRAVEELIARGHGEVQFVGGTSLAFGRFCVPESYRSVLVDRRAGPTALAKRLCYGLVLAMGRLGVRVPVKLEMLCGAFLDEQRTKMRTALRPAAYAFLHSRKQRPMHAAVRRSDEMAGVEAAPRGTSRQALVGGGRSL